MENYPYLFYYIFKYSGVIPVILGLFFWKRTVWPLRFIFLFLVVSYGFETYTFNLALQHKSNLCAMNIYNLAEHIIFTAYLLSIFEHRRSWQVYLGMAILLLLGCIYSIYFYGCDYYNTLAFTSVPIFYVIGSLIYLFQCIQKIQDERLDLNPHFYFATGALFYGASSFLVFITRLIFEDSSGLSAVIWRISWIARILFNIFIIAGVVIQIRIWKRPSPV